jgi:hypothetical protein
MTHRMPICIRCEEGTHVRKGVTAYLEKWMGEAKIDLILFLSEDCQARFEFVVPPACNGRISLPPFVTIHAGVDNFYAILDIGDQHIEANIPPGRVEDMLYSPQSELNVDSCESMESIREHRRRFRFMGQSA